LFGFRTKFSSCLPAHVNDSTPMSKRRYLARVLLLPPLQFKLFVSTLSKLLASTSSCPFSTLSSCQSARQHEIARRCRPILCYSTRVHFTLSCRFSTPLQFKLFASTPPSVKKQAVSQHFPFTIMTLSTQHKLSLQHLTERSIR